jgi:thioredoxin 1
MPIKVEAFSAPGCDKCAQAREELKAIVDEFGPHRVSWRDVDTLEEIDYAVALGVISPPAIAIDGELVFPALPSARRLRGELERRLRSIGPAVGG